MKEYICFSRNPKTHKLIGEWLDGISLVMTLGLIAMLLFTYVFNIITVQGDSMLPTFQDDDRVLACRVHGKPSNGDIVVARTENAVLIAENGKLYTKKEKHRNLIKRVIAVGGQTLDIDSEHGIVYLNGEPQEEFYTNTITKLPDLYNAFDYPFMIPEGFVFVMGDNRDASMDSRNANIGLIDEKDIDAAVLLKVSSPKRICIIK